MKASSVDLPTPEGPMQRQHFARARSPRRARRAARRSSRIVTSAERKAACAGSRRSCGGPHQARGCGRGAPAAIAATAKPRNGSSACTSAVAPISRGSPPEASATASVVTVGQRPRADQQRRQIERRPRRRSRAPPRSAPGARASAGARARRPRRAPRPSARTDMAVARVPAPPRLGERQEHIGKDEDQVHERDGGEACRRGRARRTGSAGRTGTRPAARGAARRAARSARPQACRGRSAPRIRATPSASTRAARLDDGGERERVAQRHGEARAPSRIQVASDSASRKRLRESATARRPTRAPAARCPAQHNRQRESAIRRGGNARAARRRRARAGRSARASAAERSPRTARRAARRGAPAR